MAASHNKGEIALERTLSGFRSLDLSLALALSTYSVPSPADSPVSKTPKCDMKQANGKPCKIKGLAGSPGNSLSKRRSYGQVDSVAHS